MQKLISQKNDSQYKSSEKSFGYIEVKSPISQYQTTKEKPEASKYI